MNENKRKHLEFIQNVVNRMATNSFLVKGWSVTLIAAIFALSSKEANQSFVVVVYLPIIAFWVLDGFFLSQERQYRELYKKVSGTPESEIDFDMNAADLKAPKTEWRHGTFSKTLLLFHGTIFGVVLIVMYAIPRPTP